MTTIIHSGEALLDRLWLAQLECVKGYIETAQSLGLSDSLFDNISSALELASVMTTLRVNDDTKGLDTLLNDTSDNRIGTIYTGDGVASAFYKLACAAMADDDE